MGDADEGGREMTMIGEVVGEVDDIVVGVGE